MHRAISRPLVVSEQSEAMEPPDPISIHTGPYLKHETIKIAMWSEQSVEWAKP